MSYATNLDINRFCFIQSKARCKDMEKDYMMQIFLQKYLFLDKYVSFSEDLLDYFAAFSRIFFNSFTESW